MTLSDDDVHEILRLIDESDVEELRVETGGFSLYVLRGRSAGAPPPEGPAPETEAAGDPVVTIAAPMLGTFYRASEPGAAPFVDVGSRVEPNTIVGILEVMKMMNAVPAGVTGTIAEVCAQNAEVVEYGAPLFQVRT